MLKSLMKECQISEEIIMRSSIWNNIKIMAQILIRFTITLLIFFYNRDNDVELSLSMLRAVVFTEIIIYVYAGIRRAIGKGNIEYEEYHVTFFGNDKFDGYGEYGMITSFLIRQLQEVVFLAVLTMIYIFITSQLEDVISEEMIQYITVGVFCIPYLLAFIRIARYISYFYKARNYIEAVRDDKRHNDTIRLSNNCPVAPDIICDNNGLILLLIMITWPLRAFFGNIAIIVTRFLSLASFFIGFIALGAEVLGVLIIAFKDIVPVVEMHQMTVMFALSYWPAAILVIIASIVSFYLIKYRLEMTDKMYEFNEAMIAFRYGMN